ncbi:RcnB family protein [Phenylobacterium sp.]|uniref:RcnB family protein n=1 Tax=Phenylobacterium sp. TaxID=1871053 RepID=UPI0025F9F816|nr:RcnB family protein [Phenylobacterium sp.]MCA3721418.1 RcnB family protein [Phenylobacterium sp.]
MNRKAAGPFLMAQALIPALLLGLGAASAARAQEFDAAEAPAPVDTAFQPPRGESQRFDPRGEPLDGAAAPFSAPTPPAAPEPRSDSRPDSRPEAWDRYGRPRERQTPPPPPETQPSPDRSERDRRDEHRRRDRGYGHSDRYDWHGPPYGHGGWGWRGYDSYGRYSGHDRHKSRRPPPPHYDPRWYPPVWIPSYRYRGGPWVPPPGFVPRRWSHGEVLPWTWWTPRHRIESWWSYGLPVPPLGFSWVRLGRDAALVDLWTGRIVQVAYTLFW